MTTLDLVDLSQPQLPQGIEVDHELRVEIEDQIRDAQHLRGRHENATDENLELWLGSQRPKTWKDSAAATKWMPVNRIAHAVDTHVAVMTETPPRIVFEPVETNEPALYFITDQAAQRLMQMVGLQLDVNQPLEEEQVAQLIQQTAQPQVQFQEGQDAEGNPVAQPVEVNVPIIDPEADFIRLDDQLAADALTLVHSNLWRRDDGDAWLLENVQQNVIHGWADALTQWIPDEQRFTLETLHPKMVWVDRWADSPQRKCEYVIVKQVLPVDEAVRQFPGVPEAVIKAQATETDQENIGGTSLPDKYSTPITGERYVVNLLTRWQRYQRFPLTEEEALASGAVVPATTQQEVPDEMGNPVVVEVEEPGTYVIAETGATTAPDNDNWPTRQGVRQTVLLGDLNLYDGETEFADVPVARNKYKPIVQTPYAVGLPLLMKDVQELYSRLWSIYHAYIRRYQHSETVMPVTVANELKAELGDLFSAATMRHITIPDHVIAMAGGNLQNVIMNLDPPQLTTIASDMLNFCGAELDRLGGIADVMRGEAKSEWSGELFEKAVSAARGPIGLAARNTASMLKHVGKVNAHLILDYMTDDEWQKHTKKYPVRVIQAMRQRIKLIGFDVKVTVAGAGTEEQEVANLVNVGQTIPLLQQSPTFMKQLLEKMKMSGAEQIVAEMFQAMQMQAAQQTEQVPS